MDSSFAQALRIRVGRLSTPRALLVSNLLKIPCTSEDLVVTQLRGGDKLAPEEDLE